MAMAMAMAMARARARAIKQSQKGTLFTKFVPKRDTFPDIGTLWEDVGTFGVVYGTYRFIFGTLQASPKIYWRSQ